MQFMCLYIILICYVFTMNLIQVHYSYLLNLLNYISAKRSVCRPMARGISPIDSDHFAWRQGNLLE